MDNDNIKAIFEGYNARLKAYQEGLEKDFPKPGELTSYIHALEQFAAGKLGTTTRQETYDRVIRANKKKEGRRIGTTKKTEQQYKDMVTLVR